MSRIFTAMTATACLAAVLTGRGAALASAIPLGAQSGITLAISLAGSLCLWTGIGSLLEASGITSALARFIAPVLHRIFPSAKADPVLAGYLTGNICANFLGLGNAATPMGIRAVQHMAGKSQSGTAGDEMCRLIVLNTASIQLIPATVAAVRASLGSAAPYDILPAVWLTSLCSASLGVAAAWALGKVWQNA